MMMMGRLTDEIREQNKKALMDERKRLLEYREWLNNITYEEHINAIDKCFKNVIEWAKRNAINEVILLKNPCEKEDNNKKADEIIKEENRVKQRGREFLKKIKDSNFLDNNFVIFGYGRNVELIYLGLELFLKSFLYFLSSYKANKKAIGYLVEAIKTDREIEKHLSKELLEIVKFHENINEKQLIPYYANAVAIAYRIYEDSQISKDITNLSNRCANILKTALGKSSKLKRIEKPKNCDVLCPYLNFVLPE